MKISRWNGPVLGWSFLLLLLTWYPYVEVPEVGIVIEDKLAHVAVFGLWGLLVLRMASKYEIKTLPVAVKVTIFSGILFAVVDETVQQFIPGRSFDIYDGMANIVGILFSVPLFVYMIVPIHRHFAQRQEQK